MIQRRDIEAYVPRGESAYDVVVAGGGPAGIGAALASAKRGAKTLLLEARGFFGGVAATSLWMPINRLRTAGESRGGVHELLIKKLEELGGDAYREGKVTWVDGDGLHVHPDYLKLAVYELLEEAGCHYRMYSPVTGAKKTGDVLTAAVVSTKRGQAAFAAKAFVDCTGDGDLSYHAGAEIEEGRAEDGAMMPITLGFSLANVDTDRLFAFYDTPEAMGHIFEEARKEGYSVAPWYSFDRTTVPGVASVNNGGLLDIGSLNALEAQDATVAERVGIEIATDFVKIARAKKIPGLENCSLDRTGAAIGVRETRRVVCDYVLTMEDAQSGTEFGDVIARRYGAVDLAGLKEDKDYKPMMKSGYGYPYRALLVQGVEGLLAAGRCGSYTHLALAAGKSMGNMIAIGEAAGIAAALSAEKGVTPRQLPAKDVQEALTQFGVRF